MENIKFKCKCGNENTSEEFDAHIDEENLLMTAFCNKCGKKYSKTYKLIAFEEID